MKTDLPSKQTNDAQKSTRRPKLLIVMVAFLAIGSGLLWIVQNYLELWRHIMPGSSSMVTTSMESYDVVLRVASKGGKLLDESAASKEWTLRLPRAYVTRELGTNGVVYRRTNGGGDEYFLDFQTNISEDGQTIIPTAGRTAKEQKVRSLIFDVSNREAIPSIRNYESCVPQHLQKTILEPRGDKMWKNIDCIERDLRCQIRMQVDGWKVDLAVTKELYVNPDSTCQLARQFLDKYTIKRDDIR
jgi:hypothetical protein